MKKTMILMAAAGFVLAAPALASGRSADDGGAGYRSESHERKADREHERNEYREQERQAGNTVSDARVAEILEGEGYKLFRMEREHGRIEVKAMRDGRRYELHLDARDGRIMDVEEDD